MKDLHPFLYCHVLSHCEIWKRGGFGRGDDELRKGGRGDELGALGKKWGWGGREKPVAEYLFRLSKIKM